MMKSVETNDDVAYSYIPAILTEKTCVLHLADQCESPNLEFLQKCKPLINAPSKELGYQTVDDDRARCPRKTRGPTQPIQIYHSKNAAPSTEHCSAVTVYTLCLKLAPSRCHTPSTCVGTITPDNRW